MINLASGAFLSAMGAAAALLVDRLRRRRRLGHLHRIAANTRRVQIVIPSFNISEFTPQGIQGAARIPPNIKVMPMAEGGAITQLVLALTSIGVSSIQLVPQDGYQNDADLTISVGGPSVNSASASILSANFPQFHIQYPEHIASYGSTTFSPALGQDGSLQEDYGFMFFSPVGQGRFTVVVCGVWAAGTQMAVTALLSAGRDSGVRRLLEAREPFFAVTHGIVRGLTQERVQVVEVRRTY